jgi:hypothetical protein
MAPPLHEFSTRMLKESDMPEDPKPIEDQSIEPTLPERPEPELDEETGDFITRHVLEKDSVFFEG